MIAAQPILKRPMISIISENVGLELSYIISGDANKYNQFGKLFSNNSAPKVEHICMLCASVIPLLHLHLTEMQGYVS